MRSLRVLFGFTEPINRRTYLLTGVTLAVFKYALDYTLVRAASGETWTLLAYLTPSMVIRTEVLQHGPSWLPWMMLVYTLPFAWVGLTMSVRRAADAGFSPWWGLGFVVPFANYVLIAVLCFVPTRGSWQQTPDGGPVPLRLRHALLSVLGAVGLTLGMLFISVQVLREYGTSLFIGTPLAAGVVAGFLTNREGRVSLRQTLSTALIAVLVSGGVMLLFGAEGIVCLTMAFIPAVVMVCAGAVFGRAIATSSFRDSGASGPPPAAAAVLLLALPLTAGFEAIPRETSLHEVVSSIEIDAPPNDVWQHVIRFADLDPPQHWLFDTGVAYPLRARLDGEGVGAVRHCEFSTGAFVEPITRWEPGRVLSFDVESQPPPMQEWSPYAGIHPPHLDGYFRSKRGEFRLISLPGNKTRLEGHTWYELDLAPYAYWSLIADQIVHRIHLRVLQHVKRETEG